MAPPSPRRSSRARGANSQSQHSSTSSSTSGRADRNTRSLNKTTSSAKSTPSASLSSEPPEDLEETRLTRRRNRTQDETNNLASARDRSAQLDTDMGNASDDIQEDDEAVRCICGFDDYPGPPPVEEDAKHARDGQDPEFLSTIDVSDDVSGFFVQCDICKVWQHGACVGIMTEESSPDEYFCEKCRKDLHKIHVASNGQRYSSYLPLQRQSRTTSRATSLAKEGGSRNRKSSPSSAAKSASKRRSTLNSREAGYDEDELLRRAIEASKEDAVPEGAEGTTKRAKRGRSDSEENQSSAKRQRTGSRSLSPAKERGQAIKDDDSDDTAPIKNGAPKKARAARNQRERSEREEKERARVEAANKRKVRADRRRAEGITATALLKESEAHEDVDSDPSEEMPMAVARAVSNHKPAAEVQTSVEVPPPPSSQPTPDTPPASNALASASHGKKAAPRNYLAKRTKGRNQYTKDDNDESPARSMSRDPQRGDESSGGGHHSKSSNHDSGGKQGKGKAAHQGKLSMGDMKRRVGAFLDFISRTQVELAAETNGSSSKSSEQSSPQEEVPNGLPRIQVNGDDSTKESATTETGSTVTATTLASPPADKAFKDLNCVEMMDALTRDLLRWQNQHTT